MGVTDEQKKRLLDLIQEWQGKLRLSHWRIVVEWDDPAPENAVLQVHPIPEIHHATLRVGTFFSRNDREQQNAVVHELIHCHAEPIWQTVDTTLNQLSPQARSLMTEVLRAQFEQLVDALATSFVPIA